MEKIWTDMKFNNIMHVTFFTDKLDEMIAFYTEKLGGKLKIVTRAKEYLGREGHPYAKIAEKDPEKIIIVYIEIAEGQFIELFPASEGQDEHPEWNRQKGFSHFALTVDDIFAAREELEAVGVHPATSITKGPSETYQMWIADPDGNMFEVMQYTDKSYQIIGHGIE